MIDPTQHWPHTREEVSEIILQIREHMALHVDRQDDAFLRDLGRIALQFGNDLSGCAYDADTIAALTGLDDIKPRPSGNIAVPPFPLSDEDIAEIDGGNDEET